MDAKLLLLKDLVITRDDEALSKKHDNASFLVFNKKKYCTFNNESKNKNEYNKGFFKGKRRIF